MRRVSTRALVTAGIAIALVLAGVASFYASGHPDGLEFVAQRTGFIDTAQDHASGGSPFADYATSGVDDGRLSGGLAGVAGVVVVGLLFSGLVWLLRRNQKGD